MNTSRLKKLQTKIKKPLLIRNPQHLFYLTGHYLIDGGFLLVTKKEVVLFGGFLEKVSGIQIDTLKNLPKYLAKQKIVNIEDFASIKEFSFLRELLKGIELHPV